MAQGKKEAAGMNVFFELLRTAAPLLITAAGALVSEYAGVMAVFADGFINLGAFVYYAAVYYSGVLLVGAVASIGICAAVAVPAAVATIRLKANPFLTGLALNIGVTGIISLCSVQIFGSRGVLVLPEFPGSASPVPVLTAVAWISAVLVAGILHFTKAGIYLRITGSSPDVLNVRGVHPSRWIIVAWGVAAGCAALAGCVLAAGLGAFVPNMSAGRGWTALAAVFLGQKRTARTAVAVCVFTAAEYAANNIQRVPGCENIPSAVLLSLPYITALLLIGLGFSRHRRTN